MARLARSRSNYITKWLISLMLELVDPLIPVTEHLPISEDLQKVLGDIQHGAEERLEILKDQKHKLETGAQEEMKLVLGHIEKVEEEEVTKAERKETETGDTGDPLRKRRMTQSIAALTEARQRQMMAEQEQWWMELTQGRYGPRPRASASEGAPVRSTTVTSTTSTAMATVSSSMEAEQEVDLEEAMHSQGDEEEDGYGKKYKTTSEDRTDRNAARDKQREEKEHKEKERKTMEYAEQEIQNKIAEKQKQLSEQALLEKEEKAVEERRQRYKERKRQLEEKDKECLQRKATELEKQRERERKRKEMCKEKKKGKTCDKEEEEGAPMIDNVDKDKDYDPDDDPEADFVAEDQDIEDEDTFKVEKHIHAINIVEACDYLVTMRRYMHAFEKIVCRGKLDVPREYKKLIHFVKLMIDKLGAYSPIESGDVDAVYDMIVDPQCIAWRHALHGTKTGNSKEILRVEEKRWKAERSIEQ